MIRSLVFVGIVVIGYEVGRGMRFAKARFSLGYTYLINKDKVRAREQYNLLRQIDANLAEKLRQAIESTK